MAMDARRRVVCVTGAGGFIASWLVKFLLKRGFNVHGTLRDPSNEKNAHLKKLEGATENLQLFKVDLLDYDSVRLAITECEGVFHIASPIPITKVLNPEVEVIAPAVEGTLNILKACSEAKVNRVVVVSSIAAVELDPSWPVDKIMDENCWSDKEFCRDTEKWYGLSKTLAETKALEYAEERGLDVVTVCPSMVLGPLLQSTMNASSLFLVNILSGQHETVNNKQWNYVDVRDLGESLILVYEKPEATGRYICAPYSLTVQDFVNILKSKYPEFDYPKNYTKVDGDKLFSSEKLKSLGFKFRTLEETIVDSVECHRNRLEF